MIWNKFAFINLACALIAAALWYLFPQLMAWPLLLGVVPWLMRLAHEGKWLWRTPFDMPLFLFLFTGLVSVWSAFDKDLAWEKFWTIVAGVLLFYALAAFSLPGAPDKPKRGEITTAWFLAFFGAGASLYFLMTNNWGAYPIKFAALSTVGQTLQGPLPDLPGHRLHPNVVGGILAMMIPFSAAVSMQAGRARNWSAVALGLALFGLTLFGLLLSESRGAWLAIIAALGLTILWWLVGLIAGEQVGKRRLIFAGTLLIGSVIALVIIFLLPAVPQLIMTRLPVLAGGMGRLQLFQNSLILIQEYPFIGAGLGNFMMLYSTYSYLTHVGFIIHAHNIYLDVLIEQGLVGLVAMTWMWILFAVALWRVSYGGKLRPYFGAAALSLVTILIHGMVEDALYGSRSLMLLFLPLAFALPYPKRIKESAPKQLWMVQGAALGLLIVAVLLWMRPLKSAAISNLASVRQSQLELGLYSWPEWPIQDAIRREVDLSRSISGFETALSLNPANAAANRRLGQIELSLGEYEDALEHLETAFMNTPWDHASRLLLGEALLVNGRVEEGAALWAEVDSSQGQLQSRAYWYEHIADEERLENIKAGIEK